MEQITAGAWKYRDGSKLTLFCINIAEESGTFSLQFNAKEYSLDEYELPKEFCVDGNICTVSGTIAPEDYKVWVLTKKNGF